MEVRAYRVSFARRHARINDSCRVCGAHKRDRPAWGSLDSNRHKQAVGVCENAVEAVAISKCLRLRQKLTFVNHQHNCKNDWCSGAGM